MNLQQNVQPRSSINGFGRRKVDRETGVKNESKMHFGKSASSNFGNAVNGGKTGPVVNPSRDRLIYVTTHLIGNHVEVSLRDGTIISGIFHTTNPDKDFGIILKMARVIKDGSVKGQKTISDTIKKPQFMLIQSNDLVQVIAKEFSLDTEEFSNGHTRDRRKDLMIDSAISHSHHVDVERELERWTPDVGDQECPELENIFDGTWNRKWDQFQTNEALFGVKSTFDEELYTTKLEKGPQMRELEREALRIAREIEGEDTQDVHLAEERGIQFSEDFEIDEEIRYSAVQREIDDGRFEESENSFLDAYNDETFGSSHSSAGPRLFSDILQNKFVDEVQVSSTSSSLDDEVSFHDNSDKDRHLSRPNNDHVNSVTSGFVAQSSLPVTDERRLDEKQTKDHNEGKHSLNERTESTIPDEAQTSESEEFQPSTTARGLSPSTIAESSEVAVSAGFLNPSLRSGTSTSSISECIGVGSVSSGPGLSPCSSVGSLSSERSTLNPNAKEFKLNPNAKSFTPTTSFRPPVPIPEGSFYYAGDLPPVAPMHSVSMGIGVGPSFGGHQPVYNPQAAQIQPPQAYMHPNGPMYGQQMILGQPRPVYYMPTYPPEMQYKGRNF